MIKALFFDIDGTLVSFKTHQIPVSTIEALEAAKAKGIQIFISTGRPRIIINNLAALQERKLIDGYITMNGAYCFVDDTVIYKSPIPAAEVDDKLLSRAQSPLHTGGRTRYLRQSAGRTRNRDIQQTTQNRPHPTQTLYRQPFGQGVLPTDALYRY